MNGFFRSMSPLAPGSRFIRVVSALLVPFYLNLALPFAPIVYGQPTSVPERNYSHEELLPPVVRTPERVIIKRAQAQVEMTRPDVSLPQSQDTVLGGAFSVPLIPFGESSIAEKSALVAAVRQFLEKKDEKRFAPLASFLDEFPGSVYTPSLELNLGLNYLGSAYFAKALSSFESAWDSAKMATDPVQRAIADRAFGELVHLHARLGHMHELEALFATVENRQFSGSATELVGGAKAGLGMMKSRPEASFRCGPAALGRILAFKNPASSTDSTALSNARSAIKGINLFEVYKLSQQVGLDYQIAKRTPGAPLLFPSVIHWKIGHYAALIQDRSGIITVQDPTFGPTYAASQAAIDTEASGYFLVPSGPLPAGWTTVTAEEASEIWGRGQSSIGDPNRTRENDKKVKDCEGSHGMPVVNAHAMVCSLNIVDTPVGYAPPIGPGVDIRVIYNQREAQQPTVFTYSNFGPKWNSNWIAYVSYVTVYYPLGDKIVPIDYPIVHLPGGGMESYLPKYLAIEAPLPIDPDSHCYMTRTAIDTWVRTAPDGSQMIFREMPGVYVPGKDITTTATYDTTKTGFFLSRLQDPAGNSAKLGYDMPTINGNASARLLTITDSLNQVTTLTYELNADPLKITRISDPFGRFARFAYDESGRLKQITDVLGMASDFSYLGTGDFIATLTTPYGTSKFAFGEQGAAKWLEMTDPQGAKERVEFPLFTVYDPGPAPSGMTTSTRWHNITYYWNKRAMAETPGQYQSAYQYHWLLVDNSAVNASGSVASERPALENPIHYNYAGQPGDSIQGDSGQPIKVGRVLADGSSQVYQYQYNVLGKVTSTIDPAGRVTLYVYENDNTKSGFLADLKEVRQKIGPGPADYEIVGKFTYNSQHLPLSSTDASGQTTYYTYNAVGQLRTLTNPKGDVTTFWYHLTGNPLDLVYPFDSSAPLDPAASGYLVKVDGPAPGDSDATTFIYDGYGRVRKTNDTQGYAVTMDYDSFDRPTVVTYPDGTFQQTVYDRLDPIKVRDRMGRWTTNLYNSLRQLIRTRDPLGRTTIFDWCYCGALSSVIDGNGATTAWLYDLEGRVTAKHFSDSIAFNYQYNVDGKLTSVTDAKKQKTSYLYNVDNSISQISYSNAAVATPSVSYTYDPFYLRVASMTDGVGTTTYAYNPIPTTPTLGAGMLASVTGPIAGAVVSFGYDELGRMVTRAIDGSVNTSTLHYDTLGRIDQVTNSLGVFNYGYVGVTNRADHIDYPNGQRTNFAYYPNTSPAGTGNGDQRLRQIQNLAPGGANLSTFGYTYDGNGLIQTWSQKNDAEAALTSSFKYDSASQLTEALVPTTASIIKNYVYRYDKAGNRTSEQIDSGVTAASVNNANQVTALSPSGLIRFAGTLSEPSTVTVNGVAASVDANNAFAADVPLAPGTQTVAVVATDTSNNKTTKNYQVVVSNGVSRNLQYDQAGNETDDGAGRTFAWDALNRLVKITQASGVTEFTYDGNGQRMQEKLNGAVIKQWIWAGGAQPSEERDTSGNVTKRFYARGEQIGGSNYFLTNDHLGSVREMTDSAGTVRARYSYDPYGRITKVSGDLEADFGFTGMQRHQASGLSLTMYRAYDPELGRWLSRDPIGENGGLNLYAYVGNTPINAIDSYGLAWDFTQTQGLHYNDRSSKFGFKLVGDGRGRVIPAPLGGKHTFDANRAAEILRNELSDPKRGQQLRDWVRDAFDDPAFRNKDYLREIGGGLRRTMQTLAVVAIVVSVADVAMRADTIAHNLMQHACDVKNGDDWGMIALHEDMQDLAPGFAGHIAWLIAIGQM